LPAGRVVYADTSAWRATNKPLFSEYYRLAGKPDYLVRHGQQTIPVEVKSSLAPSDGPRRSHMLQLAAYCLLVEENYSQRPKYGIVKYADRMFEIDYTDQLRSALLQLLDLMRADLVRGAAVRSHHEAARCVHCGYRHACDESLV
jgi:CRISPR-associated exonuclease Cas4